MTERRLGLKNRRKVHTYREDDRRSDISDRRKSPTDTPPVRRHAIEEDRRKQSTSVAVDKRSRKDDRRKSPKNSKNIYEVAESGIKMVKAGLAFFLLPRCELDFGKDYTGFLLAAVINTVFCESPSNQAGLQFIQDNENLNTIKKVIEEEIRPEEMFRQIITDAVRVKSFLKHDMNPKLSKSDILRFCIEPIDNLKRIGLLVPASDMPDFYEFKNNAAKFLLTCKTQFAYEKS